MPFFSVIIPLYNKEDYISDTLSSAINQLFKDFEIIIVNDESTDNSLEIVSRFDDERIKIINQKNKGVAAARNIGIKNAKANYIALLDADDTWHNNHLLELKKLIEKFPDAGLYCNNYEVLHSNNIYTKTTFNFSYNTECLIVQDYFKASIINAVALTSAVSFSKDIFFKLGGFDTYLKTGQDSDLWVRFALKHNICFNPTVTMTYKSYIENSLSKNKYNAIRYDFINRYKGEEKNNVSLKLYLDVNRYALALRCKMNNDTKLYKKLKSEIDFNNLNFKQKTLINCTQTILKGIKSFQNFLLKNNIYLTTYK